MLKRVLWDAQEPKEGIEKQILALVPAHPLVLGQKCRVNGEPEIRRYLNKAVIERPVVIGTQTDAVPGGAIALDRRRDDVSGLDDVVLQAASSTRVAVSATDAGWKAGIADYPADASGCWVAVLELYVRRSFDLAAVNHRRD